MKELLTGLDKFGFDEKTIMQTLEEKKEAIRNRDLTSQKKKTWQEEDFLFLKSVECPVCDKTFSTICVKSGRARRIGSDFDLRPRFEHIDINKYDVTSCDNCGYAALNQNFTHITSGQRKLIKEKISSNYKKTPEGISDTAMNYDNAIERYKLALYNTMIKMGHVSEKAYLCLKISWLYRGKIEELKEAGEYGEALFACQKEEKAFYRYAYDGLIEAMGKEMFPICGMNTDTYESLLAAMACELGYYDVASKMVASILTSSTASVNMKDRALDIKDIILKKKAEAEKK